MNNSVNDSEELTDAVPQNTERARFMFFVALAFLLIVGQVIPHSGASDSISATVLKINWIPLVIFGLWLLILMEGVAGALSAPDRGKPSILRLLLVSLIPPSRMTISPARPANQMWLPMGVGWRRKNQKLFDMLEQSLAMPLLAITVLVVPVVIVELTLKARIDEWPWLGIFLHVTTSLIWFAFALEFILLLSCSEKKLEYCKRNWINIIIILLPLVAFLRTLRLFRVLRMAKAGKLLRAYRLRGLLMRAQRIALLVNLIERVRRRNPQKYLAKLQEKELEKTQELVELRAKIEDVQAQIANSETAG